MSLANNPQDDKELLRHLSNELRRIGVQTKDMAMYLKKQKEEQERQDSEEKTTLEEWQPIQTQYVSSYLEKCISRMNLHEESARYYTKRHYVIIIPATVMGVITSTTAFSQWSGNVLCGQTSWVMLLVGSLMALTTLLHNLSEFVFGYKDKARQHQQSYINFSRLVKRISNEYNNPVQEHKPYRQFIESISEDYDRYTEHALMVPAAVDRMLLGRWLRNNEKAQEKEKDGSNSADDLRNSENRIVQKSTINTAIDAATIHSTTAALKTITGNDRVNEALEEYRKNRRMSPPVTINNDIIKGFKDHNPLQKVKKREEVVETNEEMNEVVAARSGNPTSASNSRRQSLVDSYESSRRQSAQTTTTTTTTTTTSGDNASRRPSLVELMEKRRSPSVEEPRRRSVVQFNVDAPKKKSDAAVFIRRSNQLQQATAKFQLANVQNMPIDSVIELNAISSSSTSSSSPPKLFSQALGVVKDKNGNPVEDPDEESPQQIQDQTVERPQNGKRRKKKKSVVVSPTQSLPLPVTKEYQFTSLKNRLEFQKRNSFPRRLATTDQDQDEDEEDITPDDVASHVFGQVTYNEIPSSSGIERSADTVYSNFAVTS